MLFTVILPCVKVKVAVVITEFVLDQMTLTIHLSYALVHKWVLELLTIHNYTIHLVGLRVSEVCRYDNMFLD
jgi:hypothetical protein